MSKLRPGILSSKSLRASETPHPLRGELADFIDNLANQYNALNVLHTTADPEMTRTGHAVKVKSAVIRTIESSGKRAVKLFGRLADYESLIIHQAKERAGLLKPYPEAHLSELRSALRQMSTAERERAIKAAFDKNDVAVIRAINEASSPVLVGEHKLPMDEMLSTFLHRHNPNLAQELEESKALSARLEIVSDSFVSSVQSMRDIALEEEAEKNQRAAKEALAVLDPLGK